jgi:hypothetical protein
MAQPTPQNVLEPQNVLDAEYQRLQDKKENVDAALDNQKRVLALSTSYSKKYAQYTKVVIALVIGLAGYLALQSLETAFPVVPSFVFDGLAVLLLAYVVYTAVTVYMEINTRSPTNYDELDLAPISQSASVTDTQKLAAEKSGNIIDATGRAQCSGDACCPGRFNRQTNLCAFTTIEGAYDELLSNKISHKNVIHPYDQMEMKL